MKLIIAIFVGGGLGSLCRYGLSSWLINYSKNLPLGTLSSNFIASAILGVTVFFLAPKLGTNHWLVAFLAIGFCGAFSTFSTFSLETIRLIQSGQWIWAAANILVSLLLCITVLLALMKAST
jgi:fluoride exporter